MQGFNRSEGISKWAAMPSEGKVKFKNDTPDFQTRVMFTMKKDSVKVFKDAGVNITDNNNSYSIFLKDDFADWILELRTAGFLTAFLNAEPLTTHMGQAQVQKLKLWIDATTDVAEAKAIFQKAYPTLHDTSNASWGTVTPWPLNRIQQLFGVLAQYLATGHAATVTGGFVYVTGAGFGWWNSVARRVWLPDSSNGMGHDMTGGSARGISRTDTRNTAGRYTAKTGRAVSPDYTGSDGTAHTGQPAGIGHMVGTILHEVGHGVGQQLNAGAGNAYAENKDNFPGFNKISIDDIANDLWVAGAHGAGTEPHVHATAKLADDDAKAFFKTELNGGSYTPPTGTPSRADIARYCKWKYSTVPLQKFWDFYVERQHPKESQLRVGRGRRAHPGGALDVGVRLAPARRDGLDEVQEAGVGPEGVVVLAVVAEGVVRRAVHALLPHGEDRRGPRPGHGHAPQGPRQEGVRPDLRW